MGRSPPPPFRIHAPVADDGKWEKDVSDWSWWVFKLPEYDNLLQSIYANHYRHIRRCSNELFCRPSTTAGKFTFFGRIAYIAQKQPVATHFLTFCGPFFVCPVVGHDHKPCVTAEPLWVSLERLAYTSIRLIATVTVVTCIYLF